MRRVAVPTVLALLSAILLVGCGSDDGEPEAGATVPLTLTSGTPSPTPPPRVAGGRDEIAGSVSDDVGKEPEVVVPKQKEPSRLLTEDIVKGDGEIAGSTSTVTVRYVGMFYDSGKTFDSSWDREKKDTFSLTGVVVGFAQGVAGMRVGGRRQIVVPPDLAYGDKGSEQVPPDQTLIFVVDLLDVA